MRSLKLAVVLALLPLGASAQDPVKVDASHYRVLVDNPSVRVLKVQVGPGEKSPMHAHPDAILVPLAGGKARFTMPGGATEDRELVKETASYTPASTHSPANVGATAVDAILVEFKAAAAGTATPPATRPGIQSVVLAEGPRGAALRATAGADFAEPAGSTHDFDQVVIALGAADMTIAIEGQAPVTRWKRGDVLFIGRGVKHAAKNASGKPIEFVVVVVR